MISSFQVGAVFSIQDRASGPMREIAIQAMRVAEAFKAAHAASQEFGKGLRIGDLARRMNVLADSTLRTSAAAGELKNVFAPAMAEVARSVEMATAATRQLNSAMAATVRTSGRAGSLGSAAAAAGGGGRGGAAAIAAGAAAGRMGGGGILAGMAPFIDAAAIYAALKSGASEELSLTSTMMALHIDPSGPQSGQARSRLQEIASQAARGTIYSRSATAAAMPVFARELGYDSMEGMEKFGSIFPIALRMAEVAEQMKLGNMNTSLSAAIEYAHMTRHYEPEGLNRSLNRLLAVSMSVNKSPAEEASILKYAIPFGQAMGIDADTIAGAVGFMQQSGLGGSTAGTGVGRLMMGLLGHSGADPGGHRGNQLRQFQNALRLRGVNPHDVAAPRGRAHDQALRALGLVDSKGQWTQTTPGGGMDLMGVLQKITEFSRAHMGNPQLVGNTLKDAFGVWGGRAAAPFTNPEALTQLERYLKFIRSSPDALTLQENMAGTTQGQFQQTIARIQDVGNTLATSTLPQLNAALQVTTQLFGGLDAWLAKHQLVTHVGAWSLLGGGIAGALGMAGGATAGIMRGSVGGMLRGGFMGSMRGGLLGAAIGALIGAFTNDSNTFDGTEHSTKSRDGRPFTSNPYIIRRFGVGNEAPNPEMLAPSRGGFISPTGIGTRTEGSLGPTGPASVTVNMGGVTINGAPSDSDGSWISRIMGAVARGLANGQHSNLGPGAGTLSAPAAAGGWPF